jgi:hypothetical protein
MEIRTAGLQSPHMQQPQAVLTSPFVRSARMLSLHLGQMVYCMACHALLLPLLLLLLLLPPSQSCHGSAALNQYAALAA